MADGKGKFEAFFREKTLRSLFSRNRKANAEGDSSHNLIPLLSPMANSVVSRCLRFLSLSADQLLQDFEKNVSDNLREHSSYARTLVEYCSCRTILVLTQRSDYLVDKDFRKLTFDMMLAWEDPGERSESIHKEPASDILTRSENEDDGSLFYSTSTSMAVQVDLKKTAGVEAFARIAILCPAIADVITARSLFYVLTNSSGGQLHFLIYDKYLGSLDKAFKAARSLSGSSASSNLGLQKMETVLDVDGAIPTQPILQHIGISAWPGRLTLTSHALYFESLGMGSYDKAVSYNLASDLKQIIKPDLTGPLGARLFDKAVMYKSSTMEEPTYFEFPEFRGHSRRDYWLSIICEIYYVHRFIRTFNLNEIQKIEALSKSIIGIIQKRAIKEAFRAVPSHFKTVLPFNLAEELPKGDEILEALYNCLKNVNIPSRIQNDHDVSLDKKIARWQLPLSLIALARMGLSLHDEMDKIEQNLQLDDAYIGEISPLEIAVSRSLNSLGPVEAARATVEQVKVEGLDTNLALMKELLFPLIEIYNRLYFLATWEDSLKSTIFLVVMVYIAFRGWIRYTLPILLVIFASIMLWHKHRNDGKPLKTLTITLSGSRSPVEQLLTLQEAISQFEALAQEGNIILLKFRALLFAALPEATNNAAVALFASAFVFLFVPLNYLVMLGLLEAFTRNMPLRKAMGDKLIRRIREWWIHIPAAPVELVKYEDSKKKK